MLYEVITRHARYENLSGGQKQRLALACALVNRPDLLFLASDQASFMLGASILVDGGKTLM